MSDLRGTWIARRFVSRILVFVVLIFVGSEVRQAYRPSPGNAALAGPNWDDGSGAIPPDAPDISSLLESAPEECKLGDKSLSDPVNLFSGEFTLTATDLVIPGRGFDFVLKRTYRSRTCSLAKGTLNLGLYELPTSIMGLNWDMSYHIFLERYVTHTSITFYDGTGRSDKFQPEGAPDGNGNQTFGRNEYFRTLVEHSDSSFTMTHADGTRWEFLPLDDGTYYRRSMISAIVDRYGNTMTFEYQPETHPVTGETIQLLSAINDTLDSVLETSGGPPQHTRSVSFHYDDLSRPTKLTSVEDWTGRAVSYLYGGGSGGSIYSVLS